MSFYLVRFTRSVQIEEFADLQIEADSEEEAREGALQLQGSGEAELDWVENGLVAHGIVSQDEISSVELIGDPDEIISTEME